MTHDTPTNPPVRTTRVRRRRRRGSNAVDREHFERIVGVAIADNCYPSEAINIAFACSVVDAYYYEPDDMTSYELWATALELGFHLGQVFEGFRDYRSAETKTS